MWSRLLPKMVGGTITTLNGVYQLPGTLPR